MPTSDQVLAGLSFPIQYFDIGDSLARVAAVDVEPFFEQLGIQQPFTPWQTVDGVQLKGALENFLSHCPPGRLPLAVLMAHAPVTVSGPVGMLAITSSTLDEAIDSGLRYADMIMPAFGMRRQHVGDEVHIVYTPRYDFGKVNAVLIEVVQATVLKLAPFLSKPMTRPTLHVTHGPLGPITDYEKTFDANFVFNAQQNKVVLARRDMGIALLAPSRTSHMLMKTTLDQQERLRPQACPVTQEIRRLVESAVRQNQTLDAQSIAHTMAMSPRTLSRRLQQEGNSLPAIRADVGVAYAEVLLLETDKSISQIAQRVGFQDATSFSRAFKRCKGKSPSKYRIG